MSQDIKIEVDDHNFTTFELTTIRHMARKYPQHSLRINDDPTNLKLYVGPYYKESYRYWLSPDGVISLVEEDKSIDEDDEGNWESVSLRDAHKHLSI